MRPDHQVPSEARARSPVRQWAVLTGRASSRDRVSPFPPFLLSSFPQVPSISVTLAGSQPTKEVKLSESQPLYYWVEL